MTAEFVNWSEVSKNVRGTTKVRAPRGTMRPRRRIDRKKARTSQLKTLGTRLFEKFLDGDVQLYTKNEGASWPYRTRKRSNVFAISGNGATGDLYVRAKDCRAAMGSGFSGLAGVIGRCTEELRNPFGFDVNSPVMPAHFRKAASGVKAGRGTRRDKFIDRVRRARNGASVRHQTGRTMVMEA